MPEYHQPEPLISVVVPTYNRARLLHRALESLRRTSGDLAIPWEIIVVDNNSADDTREVVQEFACSLPVRYVLERRRGVSRALNRGIRETRSAILAFANDDVQFLCRWPEEMLAAAGRWPKALFFGGKIVPRWMRPRPRWYALAGWVDLRGVLGWHDRGNEERPYAAHMGVPFGANMALRRLAFERYGLFRPDLGMHGARRRLGEESELLERLLAGGEQGVYVPAATVSHPVPAARLTRRFALNWYFHYGEYLSQKLAGPPGAGDGSGRPQRWILRWAAVHAARSAMGWVWCSLAGTANQAFGHQLRAMMYAGHFVDAVRRLLQ